MSNSLFIGNADYLSAAASEFFPLFGPVAPLEAMLEPAQCTPRLALLRTALADEAMLDVAFDPRCEKPWSDGVVKAVAAYTDGLVQALLAQNLPAALIAARAARHMAAQGDRTAQRWLARRAPASLKKDAPAPVLAPPPFARAPMARDSFRIASFKALPRFASQLFERHPSASALSPLLSRSACRRLEGLALPARRACLRFALHREDPVQARLLASAFAGWEDAARRMLVAGGWKPAELDRRIAGNGRGFLPGMESPKPGACTLAGAVPGWRPGISASCRAGRGARQARQKSVAFSQPDSRGAGGRQASPCREADRASGKEEVPWPDRSGGGGRRPARRGVSCAGPDAPRPFSCRTGRACRKKQESQADRQEGRTGFPVPRGTLPLPASSPASPWSSPRAPASRQGFRTWPAPSAPPTPKPYG